MYVNADTIITAAAVLGAVIAICTAAYKVIKWIQKQSEQTADIEKLRKQQQSDTQDIKDEMCVVTYAVLACLRGLKEQGCNGPVTEAIDKVQRHINKRAHDQK